MAETRSAGEAAAVLRRLLEQVADGTLEAKGTAGATVVHRLEGAAAALEAVAARAQR